MLDRIGEVPPANSNELFGVMLDRVDDLAFDLRNHDFDERKLLRATTSETAIQPNLARKLSDAARGAYIVSREEEVADKKETDIRLAATAFTGRAVIELKVGDNWSVRRLEDALETQLVGKYLRHPNCSVGGLLITYAGTTGFDNPDGPGSLSFEEVVARLQRQAESIEAREGGRIRVAVRGLDLREG